MGRTGGRTGVGGGAGKGLRSPGAEVIGECREWGDGRSCMSLTCTTQCNQMK